MENHKISIKNLGPLESIESLEIKKINLMIGESASGKSILAKAVKVFNDWDFLEEFFFSSGSIDESKRLLSYFLNAYFPQYTGYDITYHYKKDFYIEVTKGQKRVNFTLSPLLKEKIAEATSAINEYEKKEEFQDAFEKIMLLVKGDAEEQEEIPLTIDITEEQDPKGIFPRGKLTIEKMNRVQNLLKEVDMASPYEVAYDFFESLGVLSSIFIPATRSFVSDFDDLRLRRLSRPFYARRSHFREERNDITLSRFSDVYRSFLRGFDTLEEYKDLIKGTVHKIRDNKIDFITPNNQRIDIANISSGQKELFPILVILQQLSKSESPHLLIIEEPEAHLFPKDQKGIFDETVATINKSNSKVFITTHSPYMLMSCNNLIEANAKKYLEPVAYEDVSAQKLWDGTSESILDDETQLIDAEYIEAITDELYEDYQKILDSKDDDHE